MSILSNSGFGVIDGLIIFVYLGTLMAIGFYFSRKHKDKKQRDIDDWNAINKFFNTKGYLGYPFNKITKKQWGLVDE